MICMKCGEQNPEGINYCQRCNTMLPRVTPQSANTAQQQPPQKVNERYLQLKEAGENVASGAWTVDQYAFFLDHISRVLAQKEQEIRDIEIPPEAFEDFRQELEIGFAGIELYSNGIALMREFLGDGNVGHIQEGLDLIRDGNEMINEAMRINRENRRKLEEVYIDSSTTM